MGQLRGPCNNHVPKLQFREIAVKVSSTVTKCCDATYVRQNFADFFLPQIQFANVNNHTEFQYEFNNLGLGISCHGGCLRYPRLQVLLCDKCWLLRWTKKPVMLTGTVHARTRTKTSLIYSYLLQVAAKPTIAIKQQQWTQSESSQHDCTRSSADADNLFRGQSRSTNMVPFWVRCDFSLSMPPPRVTRV